MRGKKQEQWLRIAWFNVVLKEDQENAINGEQKGTVRKEIAVVSDTMRISVQNLHQRLFLPVNHRQRRMVEILREERVSEAGVHR